MNASTHTEDQNALTLAFSTVLDDDHPLVVLAADRKKRHHPKAGVNPIVDTASHLFTAMSELKATRSCRHLAKLQNELLTEINTFHRAISTPHYNAEFIIVCRYVLCAALDETIMNTEWGNNGQWDNHSLLASLNQDIDHQEKFFAILERAIKEPALYIDLMELMYLCLCMGYKGKYRGSELQQLQLDQLTDTLYKSIRAFRGDITKTLSPNKPVSIRKHKKISKKKTSLPFIAVLTACSIMTIFISLSYIMDIIANESYKNVAELGSPISQHYTA